MFPEFHFYKKNCHHSVFTTFVIYILYTKMYKTIKIISVKKCILISKKKDTIHGGNYFQISIAYVTLM